MPRMSKKRRLEWSFFLRQVKVGNTTCDRITYNDLCRGCTHSCKQSFRAVIILCPRYYSKRRKKEDRMSKKRRLEWSFFLRQVKVGNTTCDRITYNDLCRGCTHSCKQSFRAVIILCPRYYSKRRKKEDRDNGR